MGIKIIAKNKKAFFSYHIEEKFEAGIVLVGSEVKSLRLGYANLVDSYAMLRESEVVLLKTHISPYPPAAGLNHDPTRTRKLLLHRGEIVKLAGKVNQRGYTLIPLSIYFKDGRAKVELGLCRGKRQFDKRLTMKKREAKRDVARALRSKNR